jgi:hypothetical protein
MSRTITISIKPSSRIWCVPQHVLSQACKFNDLIGPLLFAFPDLSGDGLSFYHNDKPCPNHALFSSISAEHHLRLELRVGQGRFQQLAFGAFSLTFFVGNAQNLLGLQRQIAATHWIDPSSISFRSGTTIYPLRKPLDSLDDQALILDVPGHSPITLEYEGKSAVRIVPNSYSIANLSAFVQTHFCRSRSDFFDFRFTLDGRLLDSSQSIASLPSNSVLKVDITGGPIVPISPLSLIMPNETTITINVPESFPMFRVRDLFAGSHSLPIGAVEFAGVDLDSPVSDYCRAIRVIAPRITLKFAFNHLKVEIIREVSVLDRIHDLKLKLSQIPGYDDFHTISFPEEEESLLNDEIEIAQLGIASDTQFKVYVLPKPLVRLYFSDMTGSRVCLDFPFSEYPTFQSLCRFFGDRNFIEFVHQNKVLKSRSSTNFVCDPLCPIQVFQRALAVPVDVKLGSQPPTTVLINIEPDELAGSLRSRVIAQFRLAHPRVILTDSNGEEICDTSRIMEVNPDLNTLTVTCFMVSEKPGIVRSLLSKLWSFPGAKYVWGVVRKMRSSPVHLQISIGTGPASISAIIDLESFNGSIGSLLQGLGCFDNVEKLALSADGTYLSHTQQVEGLASIAVAQGDMDECSLYHFKVDEQTVDLSVMSDSTVEDLSIELLKRLAMPSAMPNILIMSFLGCELPRDSNFFSIGIPMRSTIQCSLAKSEMVTVALPNGKRVRYTVAPNSSTLELKRFIGKQEQLDYTLHELYANRRRVSSCNIADCLGTDLELKLAKNQFAFASSAGQIICELDSYATVANARQSLAERFRRPIETVILCVNGKPIPDQDSPISSFAEITIVSLLDFTFGFEGETITVVCDFDRPIGELKPAIASRISVPIADFGFFLGRERQDESRTLNDLGYPTARLNVARLANPMPESQGTVSVTNMMRQIPLTMNFAFGPGDTLGAIRADVVAKFKLGSRDFDFVVGDLVSEAMTVLALTTEIRSIGLTSENSLAVVDHGRFSPITVDAVPIMQQFRVSIAKPGSPVVIQFRIPGEEQFSVEFPPGAAVSAARAAVAERKSVSVDFITLMIGGKALHDAFLIERLRIGANPVTVYIKDMSEVLLLTAKALRSTVTE